MKRSIAAALLILALAAACAVLASARYWAPHDEPVAAATSADAANSSPAPPAPLDFDEPILVQAEGRDFRWRFRFSGRDGKLGTGDDIRAGDELHLPLGADVEVRLQSDDYVYTFSNADLQLREIAVPDLTYRVNFRAATPGRYDLMSDPMCGLRMLHDDLMGRVVIEPESEFEAWLARIE